MRLMRLLRVFQSTVDALFDGSWLFQRDVLNRVSEVSAAAIADGHFSIYFNDCLFFNQFQSIGSVLSKSVLGRINI